ncbi:MAG: methyltransferase domain-containing protein [Candidatus Omnitrophica bacterium]|nr:methyltransferase domain-containing protein [Candidatus Omnitrophota bacterium]
MSQLLRKLRRALLNEDPSFCDMHEDARAQTAAQEYLAVIRPQLQQAFGGRPLTILDAGCQAGRLLVPLAQDGHRLIGIDASIFALRRARQHANERRVRARLHRGDIGRTRRWIKPGSLDVVLCTEVLYLCPNHLDILKTLAGLLKPGGLLIASHRPPLYYIGFGLHHGDPTGAATVLGRSEGNSPEGGYHNWQTEAELRALYTTLGLRVLDCRAIDHVVRTIPPARLVEFPSLQQALAGVPHTDGLWTLPSYLLMIAQRPEPHA